MATGGTLAPPGVPRAPGAPPGVNWSRNPAVRALQAKAIAAGKDPSQVKLQAASPQRFLNRASGRMETPGAMKGYRQTAARNVTQARAATAQPKSEMEWNEKEARKNIEDRVKGEIAAETKPFENKAAQITASEAGSANRYRGFTNEAEKAGQGILANQQAGAKTTDNQAAENVLKATAPEATAGNNAATQNAGYVSPQVQAALAAGTASTAGIASAAQAKALTQGQGEENYLRDLNAQATQRYVAGQGQLAEGFGKERQTNANEEARVAARGTGAINKSIEAFNSRQSNTRLAEDKLRSEGVKLSQGQQKLGLEGQKITASERNNERTVGASERNNERTTRTSRANTLENNATRNLIAANKEANTRAGKITTSAETKILSELGSTYGTLQYLKEQRISPGKRMSQYEINKTLETGKEPVEVGGKAKTKTYNVTKNPVIRRAAEELWNHHTINAQTKAELQKLGVNVNQNFFHAVSGK